MDANSAGHSGASRVREVCLCNHSHSNDVLLCTIQVVINIRCRRIHSFGLSAADPLPSAFVMDVEDDPVVDVCRRNDLRGRSPGLD